MRVDNCIPPPIFDIVGSAIINSVVNAAVNSVDNGGVELTQRVIINSFDVDLNAILQTTVEGTREKKLNPLMSHVHAATTSPISKANATTNVANLDFILDTLSCRLESLEDVVEELQ